MHEYSLAILVGTVTKCGKLKKETGPEGPLKVLSVMVHGEKSTTTFQAAAPSEPVAFDAEVVLRGRLAELSKESMTVGRKIVVIGSLRTIPRLSGKPRHRILANQVQFLTQRTPAAKATGGK